MNWLPGVWLALIPWAGLLPMIQSWQAITLFTLTGIWIASFSEAKATVPLFPKLLAGWFGLSAIWPMVQYYSARVEQTVVRIGGHSITQSVYLPVQPLLYVWAGYAALRWFSSLSQIQTKNAITALRWSLALMFVYGVAQVLGFGFQVDNWPKVITGGTFGNPTLFAVWMSLGIPLCSTLFSVAVLILILRCASATALVSGVIAFMLKQPSVRAIAVLIMFAFAAVYRHSSIIADGFNDHGRFALWQQAKDFWQMGNVWFGQGLGAYQFVYKDHVHNDFLELLADTGIIGVSLLSILIIDAFSRVGRLRVDARSMYGGILAAGAFSALTLFTFQWTATGILILFALGRVYSETEAI